MSRNRSGPWVTWDDYAALAADRTKWINLSVEHEKEVAELQGKNAALAAENQRLTRLLLDLSDAVHFHRANADTARCSAIINRIVAEVDKDHPIS